MITYSAQDGQELWRTGCLNGEITPSPCFAAGLVFVTSPSEKLLAFRPNGTGNVAPAQAVWTSEENVPDITTPVSTGEWLFTLTTPGLITCREATTGKKQWDHDFETEFHASPIIAGNRIYLAGLKGAVAIVEAAARFKEVFRTQMEDEFHASPAFVEGHLVLKGETNIWCIGLAPERLAAQ